MHEHDLDVDAAGASAAHQQEEHGEPSEHDIGRGAEAGRPDALGPAGLLGLQAMAGNAGVAGLVAQRRADADADRPDDGTGPASPVQDVVASAGSPLEPAVRRDMEAAVGHDFGDVRVHTDAAAASSAKAVQAHAYTVGSHVVFGEGRYQPDTAEGRHTLAHELTHVVQQRQGPVDGTPAGGGIKVSDPSDRFEQEAESVAHRVSSGGSADADAPAPAPAPADVQRRAEDVADQAVVQRQAAEEEEAEEEGTVPEAAPPEATTEGGMEQPAPEATTVGGAEQPATEAPAQEEPAEEVPAGAAPAEEAEVDEEESVTAD
jgi:hypothetical protein